MRGKLRLWYETYIGKIIPNYAFFSLIFSFIFNSCIYTGTQILMKNAKHYNLTTAFDLYIPFIPEWVIVYVVCFIFWVVNYILITREGCEEWFKFATGDYLSRIICLIFFVIMPTTNVRPEVIGNDITDNIMRFIYTADPATNLFPSIHCLVSWFSYIGIKRSRIVPWWYKRFSCIFAIMVFASTQFTKQHYIIDVVAGVVIAELCLYIGRHMQLYKRICRIFEKINIKVFGEISNVEKE